MSPARSSRTLNASGSILNLKIEKRRDFDDGFFRPSLRLPGWRWPLSAPIGDPHAACNGSSARAFAIEGEHVLSSVEAASQTQNSVEAFDETPTLKQVLLEGLNGILSSFFRAASMFKVKIQRRIPTRTALLVTRQLRRPLSIFELLQVWVSFHRGTMSRFGTRVRLRIFGRPGFRRWELTA